MWSHMVVLLAPSFNKYLGFHQRGEHLQVNELIPQLPVESLNVPILPGTSHLDEECFRSKPWKPSANCLSCKLRAVVRTNILRNAPEAEQVCM